MSRTVTHAHAWLRWRSNIKDRSWQQHYDRRAKYRAAVEDGLREYYDVMDEWGGPLDYVRSAHRHVWDAARDRRHRGRRAIDRTGKSHTRPGSFDNFLKSLVKRAPDIVWVRDTSDK